jgi:phosphatidylglycerol:prolipoprotein diacylglycerol transferase
LNPIVISLGPLEVRAFTAWLGGGILACITLALTLAARRGERLLPWLDVCLAAVIGGLAGARGFHVAIEAPYFAAHPDEILDLARGGLDWHGALLGGLLGALVMARLRRADPARLLDGLALALPILSAVTWQGCAQAACAYGAEVRTLADYPGWLVVEAPDVYGALAPRLDLPTLGTGFSLALLALALALHLLRPFNRRWWDGLRPWPVLIALGIGTALLGFFRADPSPVWLDRRADQVLDLAVALVAALVFGILAMVRARRPAEMDSKR